MIKFIFALIASLALPILSFAQFDYSVSEPYRVVDGEKFYIGKEGKMLAVKRHKKEIHIQLFDSRKPALINTKVYSETELPKGFVIEKLYTFGDKCFLFFNVWDKPNKTEQLFCREIDFDKGAFTGKNELLFKIDGKITGTPLVRFGFHQSRIMGGVSLGIKINMNGSKKFGFSFSQDSSKLIIQYRRKPLEKRDKLNRDIIGMYVYNHGMKKQAGREMEMPYTEKKMDNLDYTVDSDGIPYMAAKVYPENSRGTKKKNPDGKGKIANYKIELIKVDLEKGSYKITPIEIAEKFITKLLLYESSEDNMICSGYYNTRGTATDGTFMFNLNKDGGVSDIKHHEIPVEVMNMYERKGTQKRNERKDAKGKAQFEHLTLRECVVQDDGSIILVGEQYHVKSYTTYTNGVARTRYEYLYEDILITKIAANGNLAWMNKLPKRQSSRSSSKGGMSIKYIQDKDNGNHYIMYLDNVKNIDLDIDKIPKKHVDGKGGFLTSYKVNDESGKVSKENLFDMRDVKGINVFQFNTNRITHTSGSEFLVETYKKGKEDILIKIKVK